MFKFEVKNNKGFTLIELLVVISIIGLLSTVVLAGLTTTRKRAQETKFLAEIDQLKKAFELYRTDKGFYPGEPETIISAYPNYTPDAKAFLTQELVNNHYIPELPQINEINFLEYDAGNMVFGGQETYCGSKKLKSYALIIDYNRSKFPLVTTKTWPQIDYPAIGFSPHPFDSYEVYPSYCIGE